MDKTAQEFARKIISELDAIKRTIGNAVTSAKHEGNKSDLKNNQATERQPQPDFCTQHAPPKSTPSVSSNKEAHEDKQSRFPRLTEWKPVIELGGFAILFAYTTITAFQWCETKKANAIANSALGQNAVMGERELRPYLLVNKMDMLGDPLIGKQFTGQAQIINTGHTPALHMEACADVVIMPNSKPMTDEQACPANPALRENANNEKSTLPLGPGQTPVFISSPATSMAVDPPNTDVIGMLLKGMLRIYLFGDVSYTDLLTPNITHHTRFCGRYNLSTHALDVCEKHNSID